MTRLNFFLILSWFTISIYGQDEVTLDKANALLTNAVSEGQVAGISAGILTNDSFFRLNEGYREIQTKKPFASTTAVRIASIAKPMTAIAVMQLVEKEIIKLDDKVSKYLPQFKSNDALRSITICHLLQHSSGIGHYKNKKEITNKTDYKSLEEVVSVFIDRPVLFEAGKGFEYSVYGYITLGRIIEVVSGLSYENYMKKNIWDVAGMKNTTVENLKRNNPNKSLSYHQSKPGKINIAKQINLSNRIPAGGIESTVEDLLKFSQALLEGTLINNKNFELTMENSGLKKEGNGYGLGWYLYGKNPNLGNIIGHTGGQYGCSAFLMIVPEKNSAVVVVSNTSGAMEEVSNITVSLLGLVGKLTE